MYVETKTIERVLTIFKILGVSMHCFSLRDFFFFFFLNFHKITWFSEVKVENIALVKYYEVRDITSLGFCDDEGAR